jgi:UPF0176 protein
MEHPRRREYDGTGYYVKIPQPVNIKKKATCTPGVDE